ncbi:hypothetical protein JCM11641_002437 [Rhodosporidiobolus odoratus]
MTSIAQLIGLQDIKSTPVPSTSATTLSSLTPDDFPRLATAAKHLGGDVRTVYHDLLHQREKDEKEHDRAYLERASEFVELNEQVDASTQLLTDLTSFLSTFQRDLSAVSGHISELQGRSKTIEARLQARKAVERSLHPFIESIAISPELIATIIDTDPAVETEAWIPAVRELDARLGAIRGGARVDSRKTLDEAAEALRVAASAKILNYLIHLLRPYTLSVSPSLPSLHATLLRLKPLCTFLLRHAARQAHEFQKAYTATIRWFYETGFRRYVRALEKIRTRVPGKEPELIGSAAGGTDSLALLNQRKAGTASPALSGSVSSPNLSGAASVAAAASASAVALDNSQIAGSGVILAHLANDRNYKPPPESLFRSVSLVLAENASSEYAFLASFFGSHSVLSLPPATPAPLLHTSLGNSSRGTSEASGPAAGSLRGQQKKGVAPSESGRTIVEQTKEREKEREKEKRQQRLMVDQLWRNVMEPALEYASNFTHALLHPISPSAISLLSMIRLNDALLISVTSSLSSTPVPLSSHNNSPPPSTSSPPQTPSCPSLEPHLLQIRLSLFPSFSKLMSSHADSLRKINGSQPSSGLGGFLGGVAGGGTSVKDSQVELVVNRYVGMVNSMVALSEVKSAGGSAGGAEGQRQDEEMVFSSLLRIRQELDKLLLHQASKIREEGKQKLFLRSHYEEILQGLSVGLSRHARSQAEVAHYRELVRKLG